tara:strand:+ start:5553 stop:7283 length:1731 start_codon:yes stop_codon:yes gene_type:complete
MKITWLKITNFKVFSCEEFHLDSLTAITGRNGKGKSTILNAINFLLGNGVEGEKVDGRNLLSLVPDRNQAFSVEADLEYGGDTARVERRREPTPSGFGRSKVTIDAPDGVDTLPWQMALTGKLASVAHVHEWLSINQNSLRSMIASLADKKTPIPQEVQNRLDKITYSSITEGLDMLAVSLKSEMLEAKREHRALGQTLESRRAIPAGSVEELNALMQRQRETTSVRDEIQTSMNELRDRIAHTDGQLSTYKNMVELPDDFDLERAEEIVSADWLKSIWSDAQEIVKRKDVLHIELEDLKCIARQELTCSKCGSLLPVTLARPEHIDYQVLVKEEELQEAQRDLLAANEKGLTATDVQNRARAGIHTYFCEESKVNLEQKLPPLTEAFNNLCIKLRTAEEDHLDIYKRVVDMQNALAMARIFSEGEKDLAQLDIKISNTSQTLDQVQNIITSMARFGKLALEDRIKYYYSAELGAPCVNLEEGKIGLIRGDSFYEGLALSGAERDLLATAIDCAVKDLNNTPKVILLEADSIDPENLKLTLSRIKERLDDGDIDQAILAAWYDVSDLCAGINILAL